MEIKDFWKEQWEDRKQRKQQKKGKKKILTKEDKAYKWGYIGFLIFFVVFFVVKSCTGTSGSIVEEFDDLNYYGFSKEVIEMLNRPVNESDILNGTKISQNSTWNAFVSKCNDSGLDIFQDNDFDDDKLLLDSGCDFNDFELNSVELSGALCRLIGLSENNGVVELYEFSLTNVDSVLQMESVIYLHLSNVLNNENVPNMYVRTISNIEYICDELVCTNTEMFVNNLNEEDNEFVLNKISSAIFLSKDIDGYTNQFLLDQTLLFGLMIGADVSLDGDNIKFTKMALND